MRFLDAVSKPKAYLAISVSFHFECVIAEIYLVNFLISKFKAFNTQLN